MIDVLLNPESTVQRFFLLFGAVSVVLLVVVIVLVMMVRRERRFSASLVPDVRRLDALHISNYQRDRIAAIGRLSPVHYETIVLTGELMQEYSARLANRAVDSVVRDLGGRLEAVEAQLAEFNQTGSNWGKERIGLLDERTEAHGERLTTIERQLDKLRGIIDLGEGEAPSRVE